mmetsp:Transcript_24573/g.29972  ORF Transcript_24573/g.29972 Transcript_24573/m.29972 type:complete len:231 (-) Transcript_24573:773-1465(-)
MIPFLFDSCLVDSSFFTSLSCLTILSSELFSDPESSPSISLPLCLVTIVSSTATIVFISSTLLSILLILLFILPDSLFRITFSSVTSCSIFICLSCSSCICIAVLFLMDSCSITAFNDTAFPFGIESHVIPLILFSVSIDASRLAILALAPFLLTLLLLLLFFDDSCFIISSNDTTFRSFLTPFNVIIFSLLSVLIIKLRLTALAPLTLPLLLLIILLLAFDSIALPNTS